MKRTGVKDGKCPACNRPVRRSKVFEGTTEEVAQQLHEWVPDFRHGACRDPQ